MQTHHNIANEKEEDGIKSSEKKYQKPFHFENTLESPKKGV